MFNQKEKSVLLSIDNILDAIQPTAVVSDPSETVWYLDNDESIIMMVHPRCGVIFYDAEMHILGVYDRYERNPILDLLDGWDYDHDSMVWRHIGIDQVDYTPV